MMCMTRMTTTTRMADMTTMGKKTDTKKEVLSS